MTSESSKDRIDAGRYRWLRDAAKSDGAIEVNVLDQSGLLGWVTTSGAELDAAIDAEMQAEVSR